MKQSKNNKIIYFIICVVLTTLLDSSISNYIVNSLLTSETGSFSNILEITYFENTGAAFSIFQNNILLLVIIAVIAIFFLLYLLIKHLDKISLLTCFFFAMLISGILCNTYERLHFGFVRDFFNLKLINFPIFNISDLLINLSVLAIIITVLKYNKKNSND